VISVRNVSKQFGGPRGSLSVLRDIDLEVEPGEIVAVVGTNGCGKSTLLRLIAGFLRPDSGRIVVGGEGGATPGPPAISVVPQRYRESLFPWRTVRGNLRLAFEGARGATSAAPDALIDDALRAFGLDQLKQRRPPTLSGGQAQLVAMARAFVRPETKVLLLDEPFSAMDGANLRRAAQLVVTLTAQLRSATVLITHDVDLGMLIARRIVILRPGTPGVITLPSPSDGTLDFSHLSRPQFASSKARVLELLFAPAGCQ
jgi:ABC-type nitrate/sulfonate/bicarbonate transport system ATPase subunit